MAKQIRPGAVTAMAILNFVFGGLGIVGSLCIGAGVAFLAAAIANAPPPAGQTDPMEPLKLLDRAEPNLKYFYGITLTIGFFTSIVLVIAGYGLLKMRYWGRSWSIFYAVVAIVMALIGGVMSFTMVQPAMERWQKDLEKWTQEQNNARAGKAGGAPAPAPAPMFGGGGNSATNAVSGVFGTAIGLAYPCILLYIMMLPRVRKAFAVANGDAPPEPEEPEDYYDRRDDVDAGLDRNRPLAPPPESEPRPDDPRFRARPE